MEIGKEVFYHKYMAKSQNRINKQRESKESLNNSGIYFKRITTL